eukprot:5246769-Prymnesium_polylepis.1
MQLKAERGGVPPTVKLDGCYKFVDQLATLTKGGVPSLRRCKKLTVEGKVEFARGVVIEGTVKFVNKGDGVKVAAGKTYKDETVEL